MGRDAQEMPPCVRDCRFSARRARGHFNCRLDRAEWPPSAVSRLLFICRICVSDIKICLLAVLCLDYAVLSIESGAYAPDACEFASATASEKVIKTVIKSARVGSIKSQSK